MRAEVLHSFYPSVRIDSPFGVRVTQRDTMPSGRVSDYLRTMRYCSLDYDYAREYFRSRASIQVGACTSFRIGRWYCRNLDWHYSYQCDFIVRTQGQIGVIGVAGGLSAMTKSVADSGAYTEAYRILPFYLQDGRNEYGVFANMNVVYADYGFTTKSIPMVHEDDEICSIMLVRYVLDHFHSATEAVEALRDYISVYPPKALVEQGYEIHWMIGDATKTYVVEIINNQVVFFEANKMTNFYLHGVTLHDGKVYTNVDEHKPSECGITDFGSGMERFNLIPDTIADKTAARNALNNLLFTKAYTELENVWYSEFVGRFSIGTVTADTAPDSEVLQSVLEIARNDYRNRDRNNPKTWITTHSCIYDLDNGSMYVVSQEDTENEYEFRF